MRKHSQPEVAARAGPRYRVLLAGHDPRDPAEATLVLAAAAALQGLSCDGQPMPGAEEGRPPSLRSIADELGLHVGAVRRGVHHLAAAGDVRVAAGVHVDPAAMARRWAPHRQRLRITAEARDLGLRAEPLLLAGLVAGQINQQGRLVLGRRWLAERTGWTVASGKTAGGPSRRLDAALRTAEDAGAIHRWSIPGTWQLCLAVGPSRSCERVESRSRDRVDAGDARTDAGRRVPAKHPIANPRTPHRVPANPPSRTRERPPEYPPEVHPVHPPEPEGEPIRPEPTASQQQSLAAPERPSTAATPTNGQTPDQVRQAVDRWVAAFARNGIERMDERHVVDVAGLIDQIGPRPARDPDPRRQFERAAALRAERLDLARRVIVWCPSPERLGRWLVRVSRWFLVRNLGAYLRRAAAKGDPGTVLEGATRHRVGRAVETWRDFSPAMERQLQGERAADVAQLVAAGANILATIDLAERARLRAELSQFLAADRRAAARAVLLQLIGRSRDDVAIALAVGDACTVAQARELLAA